MTIYRKCYLISVFFLFLSCKNDDCTDDGDTAPNFNIFLKLETLSGDNFLNKESFDVNKLDFSFKDVILSNVPNVARVIEKDNTNVLEFFSRFRSEISIEYEGQEITSYRLEVTEFVGNDCSTQVDNYKVFSEDGTLLCGCKVGEIITLQLNI